MITKYSITPAVIAITNAGKSASAWLKEGPDGDAGRMEVYVYHTDSTVPTAATILDLGKRLFTPQGNNDIMQISADNVNDVYYACCKNIGDTADMLVDEVV